MRTPDYSPGCLSGAIYLCGLEPQLIKLEFIIYLPKLKVSAQLGPLFWAPLGFLGQYLRGNYSF